MGRVTNLLTGSAFCWTYRFMGIFFYDSFFVTYIQEDAFLVGFNFMHFDTCIGPCTHYISTTKIKLQNSVTAWKYFLWTTFYNQHFLPSPNYWQLLICSHFYIFVFSIALYSRIMLFTVFWVLLLSLNKMYLKFIPVVCTVFSFFVSGILLYGYTAILFIHPGD